MSSEGERSQVKIVVNGNSITINGRQATALKGLMQEGSLDVPTIHDMAWGIRHSTSLGNVQSQLNVLMKKLNAASDDEHPVLSKVKLPRESGPRGFKNTVYQLSPKSKINFIEE